MQEALSDIRLTYRALTRQEGQEPQDAADSAEVDCDGPPLTDDELKMLGVNSRATSDDFVFKKVSDNGANMKRLGQRIRTTSRTGHPALATRSSSASSQSRTHANRARQRAARRAS